MMNTSFDRLEANLRALFEKKLPKLFTGHQPHQSLVEQIIRLMRANAISDATRRLHAPDLYSMKVSPEKLIEWQLHRDILDEIAESILDVGSSLGVFFTRPPEIELVPQPEIAIGAYEITAHFSVADQQLSDTAVMIQNEQGNEQPDLPENAMLIIDGKTTYPLDKPVINIGRHSSNDLILTDPHVSRHHAQLRAIKNHFSIFDVGSTGGLFLNGQRISRATLHAGDVIRVGTISLIYNQEPTLTFETSVLPVDDLEEKPGVTGQ